MFTEAIYLQGKSVVLGLTGGGDGTRGGPGHKHGASLVRSDVLRVSSATGKKM